MCPTTATAHVSTPNIPPIATGQFLGDLQVGSMTADLRGGAFLPVISLTLNWWMLRGCVALWRQQPTTAQSLCRGQQQQQLLIPGVTTARQWNADASTQFRCCWLFHGQSIPTVHTAVSLSVMSSIPRFESCQLTLVASDSLS
jgi:hypothetical protein